MPGFRSRSWTTPERVMWRALEDRLTAGTRYRLFDDQAPLSFSDFLHLLEHDDDFAAWYTQLLAGTEFKSFYWEHPPLTLDNIDDVAEFVCLDAPSLAALPADPTPFRSIFDGNSDDVIVCPNLGHDAMMIVPRAIGAQDAYPHLGAFVRLAPADQVRLLWQRTAQTARQYVGDSPRWLSTAGLGVAWLHIRLDTRPKYYRHDVYKR